MMEPADLQQHRRKINSLLQVLFKVTRTRLPTSEWPAASMKAYMYMYWPTWHTELGQDCVLLKPSLNDTDVYMYLDIILWQGPTVYM